MAWWTFRIFFIFFCSGEGNGESEALGRGGGDFLLKIPAGGGSPGRVGGEWARGRVGFCGEFGRGGGLNIFLGGRNSHQDGVG